MCTRERAHARVRVCVYVYVCACVGVRGGPETRGHGRRTVTEVEIHGTVPGVRRVGLRTRPSRPLTGFCVTGGLRKETLGPKFSSTPVA